MIKLYRRDAAGVLSYHEAWVDGTRVVEHWGTVGETGDSAHHPFAPGSDESTALENVLVAARASGYTECDDSVLIEVQYDLDSVWGSGADLALRHELQDHLDEVLGWAGLGAVDGGSIGSGQMEVTCEVIDVEIARRVILSELTRSGYPAPSRINNIDD